PARIDAVARIAAAEMVVDAALRDVVEGELDGAPERLLARALEGAPQELEEAGLREFRCVADAAVEGIDLEREPLGDAVGLFEAERVAGSGRGKPRQRRLQRADILCHLVGLVAIDVLDGAQHLGKAGAAPARRRREICAAPEWLALRRQEHGERPAALLAEQRQRVLVDGIEVGPLLAIDLDADEERVHQPGDRRVLEALMRHDVAPMAGGIADREQDRLVGRLGGGEHAGAPGLPMHRVVLVLQQVGAGFVGERVSVHEKQTAVAGRGALHPAGFDYTVRPATRANPIDLPPMPADPRLFYRQHVFCCTNTRPPGHPRGCCSEKGSEKLRNYMKVRAKELGLADVRINASGCLDRCELGPTMVIYPEGVWYSYRSTADIDEILQKHLVEGGRVERLMLQPEQK